jgi:hypothetical protein
MQQQPRRAGSDICDKAAGDFPSLQFKRRQDPDLSLTVEIAGEVAPVTWSSADIESFPPINPNNGFEDVRFDDRIATTNAARRFMRMQWTLQNAP